MTNDQEAEHIYVGGSCALGARLRSLLSGFEERRRGAKELGWG